MHKYLIRCGGLLTVTRKWASISLWQNFIGATLVVYLLSFLSFRLFLQAGRGSCWIPRRVFMNTALRRFALRRASGTLSVVCVGIRQLVTAIIFIRRLTTASPLEATCMINGSRADCLEPRCGRTMLPPALLHKPSPDQQRQSARKSACKNGNWPANGSSVLTRTASRVGRFRKLWPLGAMVEVRWHHRN